MRRATHLGEAWTEAGYTLFGLGRCPAMSAGGHTSVRCELYMVDRNVMIVLDSYEWHPRYYRRGRVRQCDADDAIAYLVAPRRIRGVPRVRSGDWRRRPIPRIPRTIFAG